ncbi:hypothetical protein F5I97DRAFT_1937890 [Phlebopus sp. FC_14]|nr:hypothetical protein F5I97DRAFT_1937890 [Phlebopus sp. FC_14]
MASESGESHYQSIRTGSKSSSKSDALVNHIQMDVNTDFAPYGLDLAHYIKGIYRVLDLISEQGSSGLVDKIIISQVSLAAFINTVCPGAYASMTKINFRTLDNFIIKPVGIYGSKEEVVRFLSELRVVDDDIAAQLLANDTFGPSKPSLRSGLYILTPEQSGRIEQAFVLYWPEQETWNDSATPSVRRNRVTFMRYLTKMCDQVVALISSIHAQSIVWNGQDKDEEDVFGMNEDESDRIYPFEVALTNEQEESVTVREGFKVCHSRFVGFLNVLPDGPVDPESIKPFLLFGETTQGFMSVRHQEARLVAEKLHTLSALQLKEYLCAHSHAIQFTKLNLQLHNNRKSDRLCLSEFLDEKSLDILIRCGLQERFGRECRDWKQDTAAVRSMSKHLYDEMRKMRQLHEENLHLDRAMREAVLDEIMRRYPSLRRETLQDIADEQTGDKLESLADILAPYPQELEQTSFNISDKQFKDHKKRIYFVKRLSARTRQLDGHAQIVDIALVGDPTEVREALTQKTRRDKGFISSAVTQFLKLFPSGHSTNGDIDKILDEANKPTHKIPDREFLEQLDSIVEEIPKLEPIATAARGSARAHLTSTISPLVKKLVSTVKKLQEEQRHASIRHEVNSQEEEQQRKLRVDLVHRLNYLSKQSQHSHILCINSVHEDKQRLYRYTHDSYRVSGSREFQADPKVIFTVHLMNLTAEDQHNLQLNPSAIPFPRFRHTHNFGLPCGCSVKRAQLLEGDKILLIVEDRIRNLSVYLESLTGLDGAIQRGRGKVLHREKIGQDIIIAFDETKHMLALVSSEKLLLHIFSHNDGRGFVAIGSAIPLNGWYNDAVLIRHACFISGSEEILLVDSHAQARVFSLITLQFRPASLDLGQIPYSVYSTPDGSCLIVVHAQGSKLAFTAYHCSTFGATEGIVLDIPNLSVGATLLVTSFVGRAAVHIVNLDLEAKRCQSYALDIRRKVTEFMFKEKGSRGYPSRTTSTTAHNCLIDCHSEVWTRFPVLPAVQRETISSSSLRSQKTLVFVTDRNYTDFAPHFCEMINNFERSTKKPTGDLLKSIRVSAAAFPVFVQELCGSNPWNVSHYRAGEWIVDFLCLIPIHIAIAKDNRFIPLKDGVYSPEMEKSLLGADVNRIVDSLSFGWYESLFQSYMASKPVKVVSSMGEQSVGKSFALNHLVDTSFAGSAMRTTEGVWMSVTPTDDALIVALDFEGVHSIERSAQEDTLLVLFNTAISNLVLFRNNFALSRDITGLFQSFQSSSTVLDPTVNPSLFKSTLVIIIKDVIDSDEAEIVREFSLKFQRIVQDEREANFISRLHDGKLDIIPWPVIESKEFYKLFPALKRRLDKQVVTHQAAGEFLHMMKTLMAKLKANDWGAMSQTMASHRAQLLSTLLSNALRFGLQEVEPEQEVLKNLDTDLPVDLPDTPSQFYCGEDGIEQSTAREHTLTVLRTAWNQAESRQDIQDSEWVENLSFHLENIVNLRIAHVREWITQNLSRFQAGHASIEELRRAFENAVVELKSNTQLCKMQCASCQLYCVQSRLHSGPHNCQTNHLCVHACSFCLELSGDYRECTMSAGHPGKHVCVVNTHLCGKPCKFQGRNGCLVECTKVVGHPDDDHLCAAAVHACGEPCDLSGVKLIDGSPYSCPGTCRIASDVSHVHHQCDARLCPIACQLCKRLCANHDHMHGLESGAVHLCGQEHLCTAACAASGICEIETAPQSIEATFTGKHETFQYTKRLKCTKPIPPGATKHKGSHNHSLDKKVVHFCEARCENCGYFCTLPLGHPQQEHETSHGSMSRTRWTVVGSDDQALEIQGRRFSTNDEGAPMMCNLVCQAMGRHVHIDYCRADKEAACTGNDEIEHLSKRLLPDPDRPKDALTHSLFWKRSGFRDPYSREEQAIFAKCDAMCSGPEHTAASGNVPQPSYCTLPLFHPPSDPNAVAPAVGYVSSDGHHFACRNPVVMQQAFHVSGSMSYDDRKPLANTPASARISFHSNNRFGAVLSSLYSFWSARAAAIASGPSGVRRDSYSVILFNHGNESPIINDFASSPDQLLDMLLRFDADGGTDFNGAVVEAQAVMENSWNTERSPVIIFLSDGECGITDQTMQDLCRTAVRLGKALSFHAVSFGPDASSTYLRRMAEIARDAQNSAPRDLLAPANATVLSSYTQALDTVQLAETFLGIAESLRKPRGALMR